MIALFLVMAASFSYEVATALGKRAVETRAQSIYTMGFLDLLWSSVLYAAIILFWRGELLFSLDSLPTFLLRVALEIPLAHMTLLAISRADRSTFSFIRVGTIPLLLAVDMVLGYHISVYQLIGIACIAAALGALFFSRGIAKLGSLLCVLTTVMAVGTLSLFKYDITHFNAVEAEQGLITVILLLYFCVMARVKAGENSFAFLLRTRSFAQAFCAGLANVLLSFPFLLAPASVITAANRGFSVLWAILSGNLYFHEKNLLLRIGLFGVLGCGLIFLALP